MRHGLRFAVLSSLAFTLCLVVAFARPAVAQSSGYAILAQAANSGVGMDVRDVTPADVKADKLTGQAGAVVESVTPDGPAEKAGIAAGDVVVEFDGEHVRSAAQLARLIQETPPGRDVNAVVVRDGKRVDLTVRPDQSWGGRNFRFDFPRVPGQSMTIRPPVLRTPSPEAPQIVPETPRPFTPRLAPPLWFYYEQGRLGIGVQDLTPQLGTYFGAKQGVLVSSVTPRSAAARAGLQAGDVITAVGGENVASGDELRRALASRKAGDEVTLSIVRDRRPQTLKVTIEDASRAVRHTI